MDAVCEGKEWDVALAYDNERLLAAMPFLIRHRFGMNYVLQPELTQFPDHISVFHRICRRHGVLTLSTMPPTCSLTNWLG